MLSFAANLAVYAANSAMPQHAAARRFFETIAARDDVVVCELMLVEFYLKLRSAAIFPNPLAAGAAAERCASFRDNANWTVVESAPVMNEVWRLAAQKSFACRRIIDARLALTLRHHGVTEFATTNPKDFAGFGFARLWNPLAACAGGLSGAAPDCQAAAAGAPPRQKIHHRNYRSDRPADALLFVPRPGSETAGSLPIRVGQWE